MLIGIIVIAIVVVVVTAFYFFLTKGKPSQGGEWIKHYNYAHRGLHDAQAPENSMKAFQNAMDHGYAIELDVHLSKDGEMVVFHDFDLERMTGVKGNVEDYTLGELQKMKLAGTEATMPTLEEVLSLVKGSVPLLIETKSIGVAGKLEETLHERLKGYEGKYAVQSFSPFSVGWFKKHEPLTPRGQLSCFFTAGADIIPKWKRFLLKHLWTNFLCRPNFISYGLEGDNLPILQRFRKKGMPVLIWTVRDNAEKKQAKEFADTIIFENFFA
ncbi:MAG: glycerophosphodiester phosphodiesterase family protein [Christensenella sp.]|nr:glycerophosphodiester phosphodiesterase family protein [Christensenella sp.]